MKYEYKIQDHSPYLNLYKDRDMTLVRKEPIGYGSAEYSIFESNELYLDLMCSNFQCYYKGELVDIELIRKIFNKFFKEKAKLKIKDLPYKVKLFDISNQVSHKSINFLNFTPKDNDINNTLDDVDDELAHKTLTKINNIISEYKKDTTQWFHCNITMNMDLSTSDGLSTRRSIIEWILNADYNFTTCYSVGKTTKIISKNIDELDDFICFLKLFDYKNCYVGYSRNINYYLCDDINDDCTYNYNSETNNGEFDEYFLGELCKLKK